MTMQFVFSATAETGLAQLTSRLTDELSSGKRVLWLLSGGSNIVGAIAVMKNIQPELQAKLTIMLGDERYGAVGHADSNEAQLLQSGFKQGSASLLSVLYPGLNLQQTAERFEALMTAAFESNDVIIAQLGIGEDGHTSGILPASQATKDVPSLTIGYTAQPFDRLTLTPRGLQQLTAAYVFAFGENKHTALQALHDEERTIQEQPSQILKQIPEVYVYNDQVRG